MVAAAGVQAGVDIETFTPIDHRSVTLSCSTSSDNIAITFPRLRTSAQPTVRLFNAGAVVLYFRLGQDPDLAATVPAGETPGDVAFPPGAIEVYPVNLDDDGGTVIAGITGSSTAVLHIAPGYGS